MVKKSTKIPDNWWNLLKKVEHDWSETETHRHYGKKVEVRVCETCHAEERYGAVYYESCSVMTDYPGDDSPCLCTRRSYLIAHGIIE